MRNTSEFVIETNTDESFYVIDECDGGNNDEEKNRMNSQQFAKDDPKLK
jgi:hypothetical protein